MEQNMSEFPSISCKCITYGRVNLLEESIESFLRQKYEGKKELVIINDYPKQKLQYNHPEIKIINTETTFPTIGHKENFAVDNCGYDIVAVWDDDDIALPNHLSNIAKYFKPDTDLLHWGRGVFFNEPNRLQITSLGNSGIVYSKNIWKKLGGHFLENAGYDMSFVVKIKQVSNKIIIANPPDNEVSWFYMWGDRCYHMSGEGTDIAGKPSALERHAAYIEQLRIEGKIPVGEIYLSPAWKKDYNSLLFNAIS
jgi:glycosyltransferase involved in cell wall biosynthesis